MAKDIPIHSKYLGVLLDEHISWNEQIYQINFTILLNISIKIIKFADILKVQNCLFMYQVEQNNAFTNSSCPLLQRQTQLPEQICIPKPVKRCTFSKNK